MSIFSSASGIGLIETSTQGLLSWRVQIGSNVFMSGTEHIVQSVMLQALCLQNKHNYTILHYQREYLPPL